MTVYVVQEVQGRNIIGAEQYGNLELLLPEGMQLVLSSQPTVNKLKRKLRNYCDDDYLLLMGDPVAMGIACAIASEMNRGKIQCLKWDRMEKRYYPVKFNLFEKGEIDD